MLTLGLGLIVAPLVVFFRDLERAVKLALRFLFYASPIVYGLSDLPTSPIDFHFWAAFNPLTGIFGMYRAAFFPSELDPFASIVSAAMAVAFFAIGLAVFRGSIRTVLKEI
jgi:ABC-2 type transport system permease protein